MARKSSKRRFVLLQGSKEVAIFTGKFPRQAALKAACAGYTSITLRERGTKKLHMFKGSRQKVRAPPGHPAWLPDMVWVPRVRKQGIKHIEKRR